MPYEFYKALHIVSIITLFTALGSLFSTFYFGQSQNTVKKIMTILHGISLLTLFVSGFGLLAKMGIMGNHIPSYVWIKILLWSVFGAIPVLMKKVIHRYPWIIFSVMLILSYTAVLTILYKPSF